MVKDVENIQESKKHKCVYVDAELHRQVKSRSAERGQTIQEFCEDALKKMLPEDSQQVA